MVSPFFRAGAWWRHAAVLTASVALVACGQVAADRTNAGAGGATPLALASRIVRPAVLQTELAAHRPVVLLFMATGCSSCAAQARALEQAMRSNPGVQVFGIDISSADSPRDLQSFLVEQELADAPFQWVIDQDGARVAQYQTAELDATVGIDRKGVVRFQNPGPTGADQLGLQLAALLAA